MDSVKSRLFAEYALKRIERKVVSKKLYRYIGFEDFVNLLVNNKDRFVRPIVWDDKNEGYLFSHMETKDDIKEIVTEMYYYLCIRNYYSISDNYFKLWHSKWFSYVQCWSRFSETDAMWRGYSYDNKAVRIRTTDDKLVEHTKKIFSNSEMISVYLKKVTYDLHKRNVLRQQIAQVKDSLFAQEPYFHKRPAFKHEGEYRLLVADNSLLSADGLTNIGVKFKIEEKVKNKTDEEIIDYLTEKIYAQRIEWNELKDNDVRIEDAGDITEYIEGVMIHPLAPQWYVKIIEDICKVKKIHFDGQSEIYTLKR